MSDDDITIPDVNEGSSVSQAGRWVLMLSHLYYDRGVSLVDDATYDEMCRQVAEHFDNLTEHLQTQLGSAEEIAATGMGVLLSRQAIGGAESLAHELGETLPPYEFKAKYECACCPAQLAPIRG